MQVARWVSVSRLDAVSVLCIPSRLGKQFEDFKYLIYQNGYWNVIVQSTLAHSYTFIYD